MILPDSVYNRVEYSDTWHFAGKDRPITRVRIEFDQSVCEWLADHNMERYHTRIQPNGQVVIRFMTCWEAAEFRLRWG